jgi:glycerophosphoryl diester phosphodiesterase
MRGVLLALPLLAAGCAVDALPQQRRAAQRPPEPAWLFACLRTNRLALVAAEHGRARPQDAENALSSFDRARKSGPLIIGADIARSADGVLMLMADERLERTTSGTGRLAAQRYRELRRLQLKAPDGDLLDEPIPSLDEALTWARRNGALLRLVARPDVPLDELVGQIRHHRMERQVLLVARSLPAVRATLRVAPEMMVEASGQTPAETMSLARLANPRLLVSAGRREPTPALVAALDKARLSAAMTSGGPEGARADDRLLAEDKGAGFGALAARGVTLFASDRAADAWDALEDAERDGAPCIEGVQP